jgi:alkylation response protein AidB-like acyl-CoA dehydrogenase
MDFELNEQQKMVRNLTRDFLEREVVPIVKDSEREGRIPRTIIENLASVGLLGGMVNEEYGGMGLDYISHALLSEEFGRVWWSLCITIPIVQTALIELTIQNWGSEEQKQRYLPRLVKGELLGTFATVEPNAGSDAAAIEASAVLDQGQWVLNGNKIWITNGTTADIALITA